MACAFEALGISAGGSAMVPAEDDDKATVAEKIGELVIRVLADDITPSKVITRDSLENAIACVCASGGSTNAVLHMIALARELDIELAMDDFERISRATPLYADLKPGGRFVATDLYAAGGVPVILKRLAEKGALHEDAITVTGKTIGEVAAEATEAPGQEVVRPLEDPLKAEGGLAILGGNLAPEGAVVKLAGTERARPGSSNAKRIASGRSRTRRSRRGTSSSSATRVLSAAPACGRCCRSPPRLSARAWGRASRWSPTGASPAPPVA
jgi:dihydroxy-acid dehydratase